MNIVGSFFTFAVLAGHQASSFTSRPMLVHSSLASLLPRTTRNAPLFGDGNDMDRADIIYPNDVKHPWEWQRAAPKTSLKKDLQQENPAPSWLINIIELAHWVSFPIGFKIAAYLFTNASAIAAAGNWGGSPIQVFLLMLSLFNMVFGGGMATFMHIYEEWVIAPFKNLLVLPSNPTAEQVDAIRTKNYNNAWLRAVAYQMLIMFESLGMSFFTMGAFGVKAWTKVLVGGTVLISLLGPKEPRFKFYRTVDGVKRPVLPVSLSLLVVLGVNVVFQLLASIKIFYPVFKTGWPFGNTLFLGKIPAALGALVASILPTALQGVGGALEGYIAESSFKQWHHLGTFMILLAGFLFLGSAYSQMVAIGPVPTAVLPSVLTWIDRL